MHNNFVLIVLLLVTVAMIVTILMQKSEGGALGIGGGGSGGRLMSGKGAKNAISKVTWWMGAIFMGLSLALTVLAAHQGGDDFIVPPGAVGNTEDGNLLPDLGSGLTPPPLEPTDQQPSAPESPIPSLAE